MWDYEIIEEKNSKKLIAQLKDYGKNDWDVCGYSFFPTSMGKGRHFVILKKQK